MGEAKSQEISCSESCRLETPGCQSTVFNSRLTVPFLLNSL